MPKSNWKKTEKGVMLNIPLQEKEHQLPLKLFFQRVKTREGRDLIAIKPCYYLYDGKTKNFKVEFLRNAVIWLEPESFVEFAKELQKL